MGNLVEKKSVSVVKNYLQTIDSKIKLIELEATARTAQDAANALQKDVGAIVKSLVFNAKDKDYYLCLVSGDKYMSVDKLSSLTNKKIIKATAEEVKEKTGFSIGGVAPVAHKYSPANTFIDINLKRFDKVFAAAGHPYVVFGISFDKLCNITKAITSDITE